MKRPQQHRFVALYQGNTICSAHIVRASDDPKLVKLVTQHLTPEPVSETPSESRPKTKRTAL